MELLSLAIIVAGLFSYSLISGRLSGTIVTAPVVFIIFGFAIGAGGFNIANVDVVHSAIHFIAEFTLILVLFSDASRIDLKRVRRDHNLPARMLIIGLPLTIAAGAIIASQLFAGFSIWEAALLAALLAPTDAALGQAVLSAKVVPVRIRQAINIESGLNDGIALPAVLLFAYAVLSLTVIRMIPVALSLVGTGMRLPTQLFLGWFGPRGLASILFVLLILEESEMLHRDALLSITIITVALSALLHGVSAAPFARLYGRFASRMGVGEENRPVAEMPLRVGHTKINDD